MGASHAPPFPTVPLGAPWAAQAVTQRAEWAGGMAEQMPVCSCCGTCCTMLSYEIDSTLCNIVCGLFSLLLAQNDLRSLVH